MVRRKKKSTAPKGVAIEDVEETYKNYPHSFVFHRGKVGKNIAQLQMDMRRVMEPFTASNLKAQRGNVLRDFIHVAGAMNVTHFIMFTKTETDNYMRLLRLPRGPTMTFRLPEYALSKDIISSLRRQNMEQKQFKHHPLLVMNNFSGSGRHLQLMATMFQNLFPSINVNKVKLSEIRRCVLLNYEEESQTIDFRHYNIRTVPVGTSRGVKKLISAKVPNLAKLNDFSDYLLRPGDTSESEAELDGEHNEVVLPQDMAARGSLKSAKSAIRLTEIGPRLRLELIKIEEGICDGEVLYHQFIKKTPEEIAALKKKRHKKKTTKELRKKQQADNLKRKEQDKEKLKQKTLVGMKKKEEEKKTGEEKGAKENEYAGLTSSEEEPEEIQDREYFRQEVGEEPEPELFPTKRGATKRRNDGPPGAAKRRKVAPSRGPRKAQSGDRSKKDGGGKKADSDRKQKKPMSDLEKYNKRKSKAKKKKVPTATLR